MTSCYLLCIPLCSVLQFVVEQVHGLPPDRCQLVSHQAPHHRDEGVRGQQRVHLNKGEQVRAPLQGGFHSSSRRRN